MPAKDPSVSEPTCPSLFDAIGIAKALARAFVVPSQRGEGTRIGIARQVYGGRLRTGRLSVLRKSRRRGGIGSIAGLDVGTGVTS